MIPQQFRFHSNSTVGKSQQAGAGWVGVMGGGGGGGP